MDIFASGAAGFGLPETVGLAAVACLGYLVGRRGGRLRRGEPSTEIALAADIARQLEAVAQSLRGDLAVHRAEVERFRKVIDRVGELPDERAWADLRKEADRFLAPTLRLVNQVAGAYERIRKQSVALADFSGDRTDPLTGLGNSRALREVIDLELATHRASGGEFAIAIFGLPALGPDAGGSEQPARLLLAAEALRPQLRESDRLVRYGLDELVVIMPHTRLYGACVFGRRVRKLLGDLGIPCSCGVAQSTAGDTPSSVLGRADSALYSAKAAPDRSAGALYLHNGKSIRSDSAPAAGDTAAPDNPRHAMEDLPTDPTKALSEPLAEDREEAAQTAHAEAQRALPAPVAAVN
ncbi:GGDEF domain-containing protein [Botrimarina sp.]|uniref:GGDEF domain-containing protein n=1 Tax=Botrimarina sp. TaxID=2795802 RepID=UPI0032F095CA